MSIRNSRSGNTAFYNIYIRTSNRSLGVQGPGESVGRSFLLVQPAIYYELDIPDECD